MATRKCSSDGDLLNVDLEVRSLTNLRPLVEALGDRLMVLHNGRIGSTHVVTFELIDQRPKTADAIIRSFVALLQDLPTAATRAWLRATSRVFDIGLQAGAKQPPHRTIIKPATLESVARLQASIVVTTYAPEGTRRD
jgi:hypothetical protein